MTDSAARQLSVRPYPVAPDEPDAWAMYDGDVFVRWFHNEQEAREALEADRANR